MSEIPSARLTAECFGEQWGETKDKIGYLTEMIIERDNAIREKCKEAIAKMRAPNVPGIDPCYNGGLLAAIKIINSVFEEINEE